MSTSTEDGYHRGGLRESLVRAALDLLAEDGAEAVSLRAVARRAGVSAMAPYRHYPNKEALLAAVAVHGFGRLRAALSAADAAGASEALTAQAVAYVRFATAHPALFALMFGPRRLGVHPDLAAAGAAAYGVLAARVAAGAGDDADREARALGCWALVHGLASLILDGCIGDRSGAPDDTLVRRVAAALLSA